MKKVTIIGVKVGSCNKEEFLKSILTSINHHKKSIILSGNINSLNIAYEIDWFRELFNSAYVVRNDSAGVQLAGRILGIEIKERMTWADFGWDLAEFCEREEITLFFLGNKPGITEKAKAKLKEKHPQLRVIGTHHGYFEKHGLENKKILDQINKVRPDILIVGFGMPLQEKWILENKDKLDVRVIMTGGNCFTFLAGEESRAPAWMHKNGLEWLYRFIKEPRRMFHRYMIGNPLFFYRVLKEKYGLEKYE